MRSRNLSFLVRALLCLALLSPARAHAQARPAQRQPRGATAAPRTRPDTAEPVLLDLRLETAAAATLQAYRILDQALIPLAQFLDLAEIEHSADTTGRIEGILQPAGSRFVFDVSRDSAVLGAKRYALRKSEKIVRDGELYVDAEQLGAIFGVTFKVEWPDLLVTVADAAPLPVVKRQLREVARRSLLRDSRSLLLPTSGAVSLGMARPGADGAVLDYSVSVPFSLSSGASETGTDAAFTLGANVLGGSLAGTLTSSSNFGRRVNKGQASWTGVWMDNAWIRQARVGDAFTTGASPRLIQGFSLGNSPYVREPGFGSGIYTGLVGERWEIEAYRAGMLVAIDTADVHGQFRISFPIAYGDNPVDFVAFGPHGEERRFNRSYRIVSELIPAKTFEYGVSAGRCQTSVTCTSAANADLRYGLSGTWTARMGVDYFRRDTLPQLVHPSARVTGLLTNTLSLDVFATARASAGASLTIQPTIDRRVQFGYTAYDRSVNQPVITPAQQQSLAFMRGYVRPSAARTPFFLSWDALRVQSEGGTRLSGTVSPSMQTTWVRYMPHLRYEHVTSTGPSDPTSQLTAGLNAFAILPPTWGRVLGRMTASTNIEAQQDVGIVNKSLTVITRLPMQDMLLSTGVSQGRGGSPTFTVSLVANRSHFRSITQAQSQAGVGGATNGVETLQGSLLFNRRASGLSLVPGPALERSGLTGRVYLDTDGDGRFGPNDMPLRNVFVRAASSATSTDSLGRYQLWDIPTFTRTAVAIDSASLESPLWLPAQTSVVIEPSPNHFRSLDLAVLPGGSIDGIVVRQAGQDRLGLPGVRVTLRNVETKETRVVSTFVDGTYNVLSVRPGTYDLLLDDRLVQRFEGTYTPVRVTIRAEPDGAQLTDVTLRIVTAAAPPPKIDIAPPTIAAPVDSDGDGVNDDTDRCANTPKGSRVDVVGCPILFTAESRTLTLRGVTFATGSAQLTPGSLAVLDTIAQSLIALPDVRVEIGGHTDNVGSVQVNVNLSRARAQSVMDYLVRRGVPSARLSAVGYGPRVPVAPNTSAAGRAQNRRVELRRQ